MQFSACCLQPQERAVQYIQARAAQSPLLVGIDGCSAAGKSTLARFIAAHLPHVTIVHGDDFYRVMGEGERAALDAVGGYQFYYDWQRLERNVLQPLRHKQPARYQQYNWITGCLGEWVQVQPHGIILVEGVYVTRPDLRAYYDITIFVQTNVVLRMRRQNERTDPAAWVARWEAAEAYYLRHDQPHTYADVVVAEQA